MEDIKKLLEEYKTLAGNTDAKSEERKMKLSLSWKLWIRMLWLRWLNHSWMRM